jgi:hypothetical protein
MASARRAKSSAASICAAISAIRICTGTCWAMASWV